MRVLTAIAVCVMLAACGNKGPLYLPESLGTQTASEQDDAESKRNTRPTTTPEASS